MPASNLTKIGVALESTYGTAPANPTVLLPVLNDIKFSSPIEVHVDDALRGVPARDFAAYQGVKHGEVDGSTYAYPDEIGYLLMALLGSDTVTGSSAPYTHAFKAAVNPPSLAFYDNNGAVDTVYAGQLLSKLSLSLVATDGILKLPFTSTGKAKASWSGTMPNDATADPLMTWRVTFTLDGNVLDCKISDGSIDFERDVQLFHCGNNSQDVCKAYAGPLGATGKVTMFLDSASDTNLYDVDSTHNLQIEWSDGTNRLVVKMPKVIFFNDPMEIDRSGAYVLLNFGWRALYDSTVGGPAEIDLTNSTASYA